MLRKNKDRHRRRPFSGLESLEPRRVLDSTVVFNEIMYNPIGDGEMEFVELHNQMAVDMDISDWRFDDGISYTFPKGTIVPGGGYLVVAKDPATLAANADALVTGPFDGRLSNAGERLELRDRSDRRMDWIEYGDDGDWPTAPDGSGTSLAKQRVDTLSNDSLNWSSSILVGGTPGSSNFGHDIDVQEERQHALVELDDLWRYDASNTDLGDAWRAPEYDDSAWDVGSETTLVGYWPLDGDGAAVVGADGVARGTPMASFDRNDAESGALEFGAEGQFVEIPGGGGLDGAESGTISMWVKWSGEQDGDCCGTFGAVTSRQANGQFSDAIISLDAPNPDLAHIVWRQSGGPAPVLIASAATIASDQWYHVAVTFSPDSSELFVNGESQGADKGAPMNSNVSIPLALGGWINDGSGFSTSAIDDVAIWDGALSSEEIAALADQSATPLSLGADHGPAFAGDVDVDGMELPLGPTTHYFRKEFDYDDDLHRTTLSLSTLIDDGAIVYLNGEEVHRQNMPDGPVTFTTTASQPVVDATLGQSIEIPTSSLRRARNVLAVEVHQSAMNDADMVFGINLDATTAAVEPFSVETLPIAINELPGKDSEGTFFIELYNHGDQALELGGMQLASGEFLHSLTDATRLGSEQFLTVEVDAAQRGQLGDLLHLYDAARGRVLSSARLDADGRGRSPDGTGPLLVTDTDTPGSANAFQLHDEIVINEIMYSYRPDTADPGHPRSFVRRPVLPVDAVWRYNESGQGLPAGWQQDVHPVGGDWKSGPGMIGFETTPDRLPEPGLNTTVDDPRENQFYTYYFETDVELSQAQIDQFGGFEYRHVIDDGAVFYVNGVEVGRFRMDDGEVNPETRASGTVSNAKLSQPVAIPPDLLRTGSNRISVEVHQRSATSNDVVFGFELIGNEDISPAVPGTDYQDNDEEWIELYNRSDRSIDLAGWSLDDAVDYQFGPQTILNPGEFIVIARDAGSLRQKFPTVADSIDGSYAGSLSNNRDRIVLRDDIGNPADVVEYFESGQWPKPADGRGSSLELRDPDADNSLGLAWAASDEARASTWNEYVYEGFAEPSAIGIDTQWREFVMGLLSDGEVLLDDIRVIEEPYNAAVDILQNGSFEGDIVGGEAAAWRIIGNHRHSEVVVDPDDPTNQVLKLVATAATEHMHNHAETTLMRDGETVPIQDGTQYRISYRAKWLTGSNQLNTRLYFGRLARTTPIVQPTAHGTPGQPNSMLESNMGPTYRQFGHSPAVPQPGENVRVQVAAADPDGVEDLTVWYNVDNGEWASAAMTLDVAAGVYAGQIPGDEAGAIVQFYVEGSDQLGQTSTYPREGRDSRALFQFDDGKATDVGLHNFRMIVRPDEGEFMHQQIEVMSNDRLGATFIYDEQEVFYDAAIKLSGSQRARPYQPRLSFQAKFPADHLFRGVHSTITLDRSESTGYGQREHIYHHGMSHAGGGLPSEYNDLFHIITPKIEHTGAAEAQLARYSDVFLDEQYENGGAGQLYEYELTYIPTQTVDRDPQSRKLPQPDTVDPITFTYQGENNENYRWGFLNKNNRAEDNYSPLKAFTQVMELRGDEFNERIEDVIDVDQWLRAFAFSVITGHGDNYGADGAQHNLQLFARPSDNRVLFFPHDLDAFFELGRSINQNADLRRLLGVPEFEHMYYGHLVDMINTTFNQEYMQRWTDHWGDLLPAQPFDRHLDQLVRRSEFVLQRVAREVEPIEYAVTSEDSAVDTTEAIIDGTAWVDVRQLRLAGSSVPLDVTWFDAQTWQASVPLVSGENTIVVEAYGFQGDLLGSDTVTVTSSATNPVLDTLSVTELDYNPAAPTTEELAVDGQLNNELFEFIELTNTGDQAINLLGVHFTSGAEFTFPSMILGPGESTLVVQDRAAFEIRYGTALPVAGEFDAGRFSNGGERVSLADVNGQTVIDFTYDDGEPWPAPADGQGPSLTRASLARSESQADSWLPLTPTPGTVELVGDFSGDGSVDTQDIGLLCDATHANDGAFDLTGDGVTDLDDLSAIVRNVLGTTHGDADLDGSFVPEDLVRILTAGQYEDDIAGNSTWATGDWNCDGESNSEDIVMAFRVGGYTVDPTEAAARDAAVTSLAVPRVHDQRPLRNARDEDRSWELHSDSSTETPARLDPIAADSVFQVASEDRSASPNRDTSDGPLTGHESLADGLDARLA